LGGLLSHTTVDGDSRSHCSSKETHRHVAATVGDHIVLRHRTQLLQIGGFQAFEK